MSNGHAAPTMHNKDYGSHCPQCVPLLDETVDLTVRNKRMPTYIASPCEKTQRTSLAHVNTRGWGSAGVGVHGKKDCGTDGDVRTGVARRPRRSWASAPGSCNANARGHGPLHQSPTSTPTPRANPASTHAPNINPTSIQHQSNINPALL